MTLETQSLPPLALLFRLPESIRRVYADAFKIDLPTYNGDDSWSLPMPARFIVDQHAVIRAADVNLDHTIVPNLIRPLTS